MERGFALPMVLALIVLGGILATAGFLLSRLESQAGTSALHAWRAEEAAESGLAEAVRQWDASLDSLPVGAGLGWVSGASGSAHFSTAVIRLDDGLYRIEATGRFLAPGMAWPSERRLSRLLRWEPALPPPAVLSVTDSLLLGPGTVVSGLGPGPAGWGQGCGPDSVAAVRARAGAALDTTACPGCLAGLPIVHWDSAFAGIVPGLWPLDYFALASAAAWTPAGSLALLGPSTLGPGGPCDRADPLNWGDPDHTGSGPCRSWLPVIHAAGDLVLAGGRGQGVLLVDGDLSVDGSLEFAGLVVVLGRASITTGTSHFSGSILASTITVADSASVTFEYSACVLRKALRGTSRAIPLPSRSWAQHY